MILSLNEKKMFFIWKFCKKIRPYLISISLKWLNIFATATSNVVVYWLHYFHIVYIVSNLTKSCWVLLIDYEFHALWWTLHFTFWTPIIGVDNNNGWFPCMNNRRPIYFEKATIDLIIFSVFTIFIVFNDCFPNAYMNWDKT